MVAIASLFYPIAWWIILYCIDYINYRRYNASLIRTETRLFWYVIVPLSTLFWLYFESVNFFFEQWRYINITFSIPMRTINGFISFATVIPILIELLWFFIGTVRMPHISHHIQKTLKHPGIFFISGVIFIVLPFISDYFWINQLMWVGPFFLLFPFIKKTEENPPLSLSRCIVYIIFIALAGGFLWELLNYFAPITKWQYTILPEAFRLFAMPLLGYLGYIPFIFSVIVVYLFAKQFLKPTMWLSIGLYSAALIASYLFAVIVV